MRRIVIDAPLLLSWFARDGEGRPLRAEYEAGRLAIVAPAALPADIIGLVARRDELPADRLVRIAAELERLGFELRQPAPASVATWVARGLNPDRAAYPALAASLDLNLATNDPELRRVAGPLASAP